MKSTYSAIIIAVLLFSRLMLFPAYGEPEDEKEKEPTLYAQSAVLMDADSGRVLYGKNEDLQRPMASTTKIMTCILALENGNLEDIATASSNAAGQPKVHLGVRSGQTFYLKDLLYSLMLESHNDAAVIIAEHIGGSVEEFAAMMNQKARDLGCNDTFFITPNGLDAAATDENGTEKVHSTTARDLARIMRYCILESPKKEEFLEITRTQNYYFTDTLGKSTFNCTNHNAFLSMMSGALSGKTGFTGGAGYSYIGALKDGDRTFIVALLGCGWPPHKTYKWSDTRTLMNFGLNNYQYKDVWQNISLNPIPIENGVPTGEDISEKVDMELTLLVSKEQQSLPILLKDGEKVQVKYQTERVLKAPVEAGKIVGNVVYSLNGDVVKSFPIVTTKSVDKITVSWCMEKIMETFLLSA